MLEVYGVEGVNFWLWLWAVEAQGRRVVGT